MRMYAHHSVNTLKQQLVINKMEITTGANSVCENE